MMYFELTRRVWRFPTHRNDKCLRRWNANLIITHYIYISSYFTVHQKYIYKFYVSITKNSATFKQQQRKKIRKSWKEVKSWPNSSPSTTLPCFSLMNQLCRTVEGYHILPIWYETLSTYGVFRKRNQGGDAHSRKIINYWRLQESWKLGSKRVEREEGDIQTQWQVEICRTQTKISGGSVMMLTLPKDKGTMVYFIIRTKVNTNVVSTRKSNWMGKKHLRHCIC